jgi:hypothetical protein
VPIGSFGADQIFVDDRTIDSHIKRVRQKFRAVDDTFDRIETLYGAIASKIPEASVTSPPFLFCSLARRVSNIAGSFLFALQQRRTFGLFGSDESLGFLCFALGLQNEISSTGSLFGQFGLMHHFGGFALGNADQARLVHCRSGSASFRDSRVFGRCAKPVQHRLLYCGSVTLTLFRIKAFVTAHLISRVIPPWMGTGTCRARLTMQPRL